MMTIRRSRAMAGIFTLVSVAFVIASGPANAEPIDCPAGSIVDESGCSLRLVSVTADSAQGTMTGTPVGGSTPITVAGEADSYLPSTGFGSAPPDAVQQWDATIDRVDHPSDPNSYGQGKAKAFLPRQLNELATRLPANTIVLRFVPGGEDPRVSVLLSIQPVA